MGANRVERSEDEPDVTIDLPQKYFQQKHSFTRSLVEWIIILVVAVLAALVMKTYVVQTFYIPSESMERTLLINDRVLVNKLALRVGKIHRGDIIVFDRPPGLTAQPGIKDVIKRVIGVPGDTVEARGGRVYVNGESISEPYVWPEGTATTWQNNGPITLEPGKYFVMGDNRGRSADSRVFGPIDEELIVGRAVLRFWPTSRFGTL